MGLGLGLGLGGMGLGLGFLIKKNILYLFGQVGRVSTRPKT
jgi:hypothetical protein